MANGIGLTERIGLGLASVAPLLGQMQPESILEGFLIGASLGAAGGQRRQENLIDLQLKQVQAAQTLAQLGLDATAQFQALPGLLPGGAGGLEAGIGPEGLSFRTPAGGVIEADPAEVRLLREALGTDTATNLNEQLVGTLVADPQQAAALGPLVRGLKPTEAFAAIRLANIGMRPDAILRQSVEASQASLRADLASLSTQIRNVGDESLAHVLGQQDLSTFGVAPRLLDKPLLDLTPDEIASMPSSTRKVLTGMVETRRQRVQSLTRDRRRLERIDAAAWPGTPNNLSVMDYDRRLRDVRSGVGLDIIDLFADTPAGQTDNPALWFRGLEDFARDTAGLRWPGGFGPDHARLLIERYRPALHGLLEAEAKEPGERDPFIGGLEFPDAQGQQRFTREEIANLAADPALNPDRLSADEFRRRLVESGIAREITVDESR